MPLTYTYADGYVAPQVTTDRETRAIADVAAIGTLPSDWAQRLAILRAYILTCLECAKSPDDMWTTKLSAYRKEFEAALSQARAAQAALDAASASAGAASFFTAQIERA